MITYDGEDFVADVVQRGDLLPVEHVKQVELGGIEGRFRRKHPKKSPVLGFVGQGGRGARIRQLKHKEENST